MPNVKHYSKVLQPPHKNCPINSLTPKIDQFSRRPPMGDAATSAAQIKKNVNSPGKSTPLRALMYFVTCALQ